MIYCYETEFSFYFNPHIYVLRVYFCIYIIRKYLKFMLVFLEDKVCSVDHDLVVDTGESVDYLVKHFHSRLFAFSFLGDYLQNVPVQIKGIFQLRNLILQLVIFLLQ